MQLTIIIVSVMLVGLVVGFFIGQVRTGRMWNRMMEENVCNHDSTEAHVLIKTLSFLHDGRHTNAVALLESRLDGVLLTFLAAGRLHPDAEDPGTRAVHVARDYRARHPWHSPRPEIQKAVHRVLSSAK